VNGRFRAAVSGPFRLSLTAAQQRTLVAVQERTLGNWPAAVGHLIDRGLVLRIGDALSVTVAGQHVLGLMKEAGLYDEAKAGEPAASDDGALLP
jgi:hypothetical protein